MSRRIGFALLVVLAATGARADFDSLVRVVGSSRGLHRVWTPGISFVRLGVRVMHPDGVHDFQLAVFEGKGDVDFERALRTMPGMPMVSSHNNDTGETALIWARPLDRDLFEMLVLAHDPGDDTVVVRAVVDGEMLARELADPKHPQRLAGE
jgi:hypothetical protein